VTITEGAAIMPFEVSRRLKRNCQKRVWEAVCNGFLEGKTKKMWEPTAPEYKKRLHVNIAKEEIKQLL